MDFDKFFKFADFNKRRLFGNTILLILLVSTEILLSAKLYILYFQKWIDFFHLPLTLKIFGGTIIETVILVLAFTLLRLFIIYIWHLIIAVWPWSKTCYFEYVPRENLKGLIFQGNVEAINDSLLITNSGGGLLFKGLDLWWKDFITEFRFKFDDNGQKYNAVGFIFRAQDLQNYFMIQILGKKSDENYKLEIHCNSRLNGDWDVGATNDLAMSVNANEFMYVKCSVKENEATITINNISKKWILPTDFESNLGKDKEKPEPVYNIIAQRNTMLPFRNKFGMIGFRAWGNEKAIIKDIKIRKI